MRASQHSKDKEKAEYHFKRIHIITGDAFDTAEAMHCEALLIRLLEADGTMKVVNPRKGNKKNFYARQQIFEGEFDQLWIRLQEMGLVRSRDVRTVVNSQMYKYFPNAELNIQQKNALEFIVNTLDSGELAAPGKPYKNRPVVVEGNMGTGKTVLAVALFQYLKTHEPYCYKKIGFVVPHPATRDVIGRVFRDTQGLFRKDSMGPTQITKEHYDIIICDEAHKLRKNMNQRTYGRNFKNACERLGLDTSADELDWILKQSDYQILFYDPVQRVSPSNIDSESMKRRLYDEWGRFRPVILDDQMRIKAGKGYVEYIRHVLKQACSSPKYFENYELKLFDSFKEMHEKILEKEEQYGLCRLCTGYGWKWSGDKKEDASDIVLDGISIKWNSCTTGWLCDEKLKYEMGSVYSLHGLDLNYAGVVIGPELYFDENSGKIRINEEHFFDEMLKRGTSEEEQLEFLQNIYAVLMCRGIEGTYVYVCDEGLRRYMRKFIPG